MRFCAELQESATGRILWTEHYDRELGEVGFDFLDNLAGMLACRLDQEVELAEIIRASRKPIEALSAYDCVLRAIPLIFKLTQESFMEAGRLLLSAQDADPYNSLVYSWRAFWYSMYICQSWVRNLETARSELDFLVRRAIELDPKNALALSMAGHIASYVDHNYDHALSLFKQSLQIDPNSAYTWRFNAVTLCYTGHADEALQQLESCRGFWQQRPDSYYYQTARCVAFLLAGQHERAAVEGKGTLSENPNYQAAYRPLIASLGLCGNTEEARAYLTDLRQLQPDFSIDWFRGSYPPLHTDYHHRYIEGLRKAGVQ